MLSIITQIIIYAGIVQGVYSAIVLTHIKLRNPANRYLAFLLLILSISIIHSAFAIPFFHQFHNTSFHVKEPFLLLVVPFIWLYVKKLNEPHFSFKSKHLLHFAPFLVVLIFNVFLVFHNTQIEVNQSLNSHTFVLNLTLYIIAFCQYIFYMVYILRIIRNFKIKALNELSNTENIDPAWLRIFLVTFLAVFLLLIVMMVIAIHRLKAEYFNNIVSLVFALAIYILGYKGMFQQTMLPVMPEIVNDNSISYEKPSPETRIDEQLLFKMRLFMEEKKPYHDPELTLISLALQVNIGRNQLSELINTGTGGNFYDFVNKYRVDEVMQLMENPNYKDYTLLAIAFEAGFPSKSTFNSIFKKYTGITPSVYRNRLL